ncbi:transcriptional regulator, DeoR family [Paramicrobacterium humi]|uniref:Transcriptional regulator, DeoR family n=1 Tax=Paramicrobacterium humi TaxID=640635 RepID=A0A1H4KKV8_9MICO|nr:DeoR/GlpR family DNA-binding transcription regulator [Microbacterium humi]SEB58542.1 transcriptional regulator, DeoR family [Microbacterium humi]
MRYTEAPARRAEILRRLEETGYVSSGQLAAEFGVSEMTIRRDVRQLQLEGRARRVTGGATLVGSIPFDERTRSGAREKREIAAACAALLPPSGTVALDAGTTVAPLADLVGPGSTVVSHSAPVISACTARDDIELIGVGGVYQRDTRSFAGPGAASAFESLSVDVAVLSVTAVDAAGLMCANMLDAEVKKRMAGSAETVIVLADHTKLARRASIRIGPLALADVLVTDAGASPELLSAVRDTGVRVVIADDEESVVV